MVGRQRANAQVSRDHRCHQWREPPTTTTQQLCCCSSSLSSRCRPRACSSASPLLEANYSGVFGPPTGLESNTAEGSATSTDRNRLRRRAPTLTLWAKHGGTQGDTVRRFLQVGGMGGTGWDG